MEYIEIRCRYSVPELLTAGQEAVAAFFEPISLRMVCSLGPIPEQLNFLAHYLIAKGTSPARLFNTA